jgi:hypothetical protein
VGHFSQASKFYLQGAQFDTSVSDEDAVAQDNIGAKA